MSMALTFFNIQKSDAGVINSCHVTLQAHVSILFVVSCNSTILSKNNINNIRPI